MIWNSHRRFTPVRTGKRHIDISTAFRVPVHPRAYGEEDHYRILRVALSGSPPCVRGRGVDSRNPRVGIRFTPVRTGKRPVRTSPTPL